MIGVSLIGSLALFGVYQRSESRARESALALAYFPLDLREPLVYHITKSLIRRNAFEKQPSVETADDAYYSRLTLEKGHAARTEKCISVEMALRTLSDSKGEDLELQADGIHLSPTGLLLVPLLTPLKPRSWSLSFGLTRGGDGFFGWPLLEVIGMTDRENALFAAAGAFGEADTARQTVFNVMREETLRVFQTAGEDVTLGGKEIRTVKLEYSGQLSRLNTFHQIAGAIWLAPGLGVIKEQRRVIYRAYERSRDPARGNRDTVIFEADVTKLLAHPI